MDESDVPPPPTTPPPSPQESGYYAPYGWAPAPVPPKKSRRKLFFAVGVADDRCLQTVRPIFDSYSDAVGTIGDCDRISVGHATCRAYARGGTRAGIGNLLVRPPFSMTAYDAAQVNQAAHDAYCPNVTLTNEPS